VENNEVKNARKRGFKESNSFLFGMWEGGGVVLTKVEQELLPWKKPIGEKGIGRSSFSNMKHHYMDGLKK
jgi:hypothetical protein